MKTKTQTTTQCCECLKTATVILPCAMWACASCGVIQNVIPTAREYDRLVINAIAASNRRMN